MKRNHLIAIAGTCFFVLMGYTLIDFYRSGEDAGEIESKGDRKSVV